MFGRRGRRLGEGLRFGGSYRVSWEERKLLLASDLVLQKSVETSLDAADTSVRATGGPPHKGCLRPVVSGPPGEG